MARGATKKARAQRDRRAERPSRTEHDRRLVLVDCDGCGRRQRNEQAAARSHRRTDWNTRCACGSETASYAR